MEEVDANPMPEFDADGGIIVAAFDHPDPTHDLIDSGTAESSTGDDGGAQVFIFRHIGI